MRETGTHCVRNRNPLGLKNRNPLCVRNRYPLNVRNKNPLGVRNRCPLSVRNRYPLCVRKRYPLRVRNRNPLGVRNRKPLVVRPWTSGNLTDGKELNVGDFMFPVSHGFWTPLIREYFPFHRGLFLEENFPEVMPVSQNLPQAFRTTKRLGFAKLLFSSLGSDLLVLK